LPSHRHAGAPLHSRPYIFRRYRRYGTIAEGDEAPEIALPDAHIIARYPWARPFAAFALVERELMAFLEVEFAVEAREFIRRYGKRHEAEHYWNDKPFHAM
jgi:hypothetical protein